MSCQVRRIGASLAQRGHHTRLTGVARRCQLFNNDYPPYPYFDKIGFYWPFPTGGQFGTSYIVQAVSNITNGTNTYTVGAVANYVVFGPSASETETTIAPSVSYRGAAFPNQQFLQDGTEVNYPTSAGMHFKLSFSMPKTGNGGSIAYLQLVNVGASTTNIPSPLPWHTSPPGGAMEEDGCLIESWIPAPVATGTSTPEADAPGWLLTGAPTSSPGASVTATWAFQDFWLYLPNTANSIWVPILATPTYSWSGTAVEAAAPTSSPWALKASVPMPPTVAASPATAAPIWTGVLYPQTFCIEPPPSPPSLPTP